ncbi:MAG: type IX secretion system protein PorQ [Bacteroidales bacterium]|nr:type IX secretion system protein PorQ [Bacteroidales bacterium]
MKRLVLILFLGCFSFVAVNAQSGGAAFSFVDMGQTARIASLGGEAIAASDNDLGNVLFNPSLLSSSMNNNISFSFVNYFSGINYGTVSYARQFKKVGNFAFHAQYANYGTILVTDIMGVEHGTASANDIALIAGWSKSIIDSQFTIGANAKFLFSQMHYYFGMALGVDVSATYTLPNKNFAASLLLRNIGAEIKSYYGDDLAWMPFEISVALYGKIPHAPFRVFFEVTNLQRWKLNYDNPYAQRDIETGELKKMSKAKSFFDNLARHLVLGVEVIPYKNIYLRAAYNYNRGADLVNSDKPGMVGFSWGVGFRVYKFDLSYARSSFYRLGSPNYITLSMNLNSFNKKR